jgi:hypothetical protein
MEGPSGEKSNLPSTRKKKKKKRQQRTGSLALITHRGDTEKVAICLQAKETSSELNPAETLILDFSASKTVRNSFLWFKPIVKVYCIFVIYAMLKSGCSFQRF